jgi:hypothetical protein
VRCLALRRGNRPHAASAGGPRSFTNDAAAAAAAADDDDDEGSLGTATEGDALALDGSVSFEASASAPPPPKLPGGQLLLYTGDDAGTVNNNARAHVWTRSETGGGGGVDYAAAVLVLEALSMLALFSSIFVVPWKPLCRRTSIAFHALRFHPPVSFLVGIPN